MAEKSLAEILDERLAKARDRIPWAFFLGVFDRDGLPLGVSRVEGPTEEDVGGAAAAILGLVGEALKGADLGELRQSVFYLGKSIAFFKVLPTEHVLVLLCTPDARLGWVLQEGERLTQELFELLT